MDLGKRFKRYREKNDLTQVAAADLIGVKYYQLGNYETNRSEPSINTLKKMSEVYGVSIDTLVGNHVAADKTSCKSADDLQDILGDLQSIIKKYEKN